MREEDEAYMIARRGKRPEAPAPGRGTTTFALRIYGTEDAREGFGAYLCGGHWSTAMPEDARSISMDGGPEMDSAVGSFDGELSPEDLEVGPGTVRDGKAVLSLAQAVVLFDVMVEGEVRTPAGRRNVRIDTEDAYYGPLRA